MFKMLIVTAFSAVLGLVSGVALSAVALEEQVNQNVKSVFLNDYYAMVVGKTERGTAWNDMLTDGFRTEQVEKVDYAWFDQVKVVVRGHRNNLPSTFTARVATSGTCPTRSARPPFRSPPHWATRPRRNIGPRPLPSIRPAGPRGRPDRRPP